MSETLEANASTESKKKRLKADLVVIGAGAGGLSAAAGCAMLGLKVVLYEKGEMGGDCLNYGCVPSKALIAAAKQAQAFREAGKFGLTSADPGVDWKRVQAHVKEAIATIEPNDSQERFEGLGVTVIREEAHFVTENVVASASTQVEGKRIIIATGSRAFVPPIDGLEDTPYLSNETLFDVEELPEHLIILGGGPIGIEMAQAFNRLGAKVTVIERARAMERADEEHAAIAVEELRKEGVEILERTTATGTSQTGSGVRVETKTADGEVDAVTGSHLLVATGRVPVIESLALEAGGVDFDRHGVKTKPNLRSVSNGRVWALGDAAGRGQFTHLAGWHASVFVRNALFKSAARADSLPTPAVTYTSPEVAQVGITEKQAREEHGEKVRVSHFEFKENDRAIAEKDTIGGAKIVTLKNGTVLGVSVVGEGAGDIIQLASVAMSNGLKIRALTNFISPYPTRAEILKRAASKWYEPLVFGKKGKFMVKFLQNF